MSIFNEYVEENIVSLEYDPVTGIEFESIDTSSLTEICIDLRESCTYLNAKMYVIEVMENLGLTEPLEEGVVGATKDFFNAIIEKIKKFFTMVKNFFANIFKKMELMFTVNGKSFLDKYGDGISKSFTSGKAEWVEYNERYVLTKKEHDQIFEKIDAAINLAISEYTTVHNTVLKIAEVAKQDNRNKDENGNTDDEKVNNSVNYSVKSMNNGLSSEELTSKFNETEKKVSNVLYTGAESYDDVKEKFKDNTSEKDKDQTKVLDNRIGAQFLSYCKKHVSSDIIELKNTQTKITTLINNTQNYIKALDNKYGNVDDNGSIGPIRNACNFYMKTLSFLQELNSKRVSTRTQTFNYYIAVLKRYTKKNYNLIVGTPSKEKKENKK